MKKTLFLLSLVLIFALSACAPSLTPSQAGENNSAGEGGQAGKAPVSNPQPAGNQSGDQTGSQYQAPTPVSATRSISVNGTGQVILAPEIAYVYVGVHSQADAVGDALADNNSKSQAVAEALKGMGIEAKDIQTSSFNIYPQPQYSPQGEMTKTIYNVDNTVYVTVRNLQILGQLLDTAVRAGANSINGITFDVKDDTKSKAISEARKIAVDSARAQAEALANAAGVSLGDLLTLSAVLTGTPVAMNDMKTSYTGASQVPISAGQIVIHVEVSASYAIK